MDIPSKHNISFSRHLWLSVMALFLAITACFMFYQYRREKTYRADIIDARLQCYNTIISTSIDNPEQWPKDVRITILKVDGSVVADNVDNSTDVNHLDRPEVIDAIKLGTGKDIRRKSATVGDEYFYSATYFKDKELIVRTALPYNHSLIDMLAADKDFLWLSIVLIIFFAIIYEQYTQYLGQKIESKRRKLQNKLEQSEEDKLRMKQQLTQNVAHELKTPVSSIKGFLDILVNAEDLPEKQRNDFLKRCHSQATRLANILRDISMLTRIDDAPKLFEKAECDLHEIVDAVSEDLAENLNKHQDTIINCISSDCIILGNYSLLYSIFRNLVDNAISYAGENITISISGQKLGDEIKVSFADNGKGVAEEHLPYIFERFYRVDKGRSRSMGGTGLGLAIVKHAVILHGGHIEASQTKGGGLQFDFNLKG